MPVIVFAVTIMLLSSKRCRKFLSRRFHPADENTQNLYRIEFASITKGEEHSEQPARERLVPGEAAIGLEIRWALERFGTSEVSMRVRPADAKEYDTYYA